MSKITAQEWELLACFAVEPTLLDPDEHWSDNDVVDLVDVDGLTVSFAVQPSQKDIRLIVRRCEQILFELNAMDVTDVRIVNKPGYDLVEILLSQAWCVRLQLRPTFKFRRVGTAHRVNADDWSLWAVPTLRNYWFQVMKINSLSGRLHFDLDDREIRKAFGKGLVEAVEAAKGARFEHGETP